MWTGCPVDSSQRVSCCYKKARQLSDANQLATVRNPALSFDTLRFVYINLSSLCPFTNYCKNCRRTQINLQLGNRAKFTTFSARKLMFTKSRYQLETVQSAALLARSQSAIHSNRALHVCLQGSAYCSALRLDFIPLGTLRVTLDLSQTQTCSESTSGRHTNLGLLFAGVGCPPAAVNTDSIDIDAAVGWTRSASERS